MYGIMITGRFNEVPCFFTIFLLCRCGLDLTFVLTLLKDHQDNHMHGMPLQQAMNLDERSYQLSHMYNCFLEMTAGHCVKIQKR